jgi:hypothetical protein
MSVSENIRTLAREGLSTAEIARRLGIRYQHAYNVLRADGALRTAHCFQSCRENNGRPSASCCHSVKAATHGG